MSEEKELEFKPINCKCGKPMEDTEKKIHSVVYPDLEFALFACNWCGAQALFRLLEDNECYEI